MSETALHELPPADGVGSKDPAGAAAVVSVALAPAHFWRWRALTAELRAAALARDRAQLAARVQVLEAEAQIAGLHEQESQLWTAFEREYGLDRRRNYVANDDACSVTPV